MRRRRRTKYTWFPQIGTEGAEEADDTVVLDVSIPTPNPVALGLSDVNIFPILPDAPKETVGVADDAHLSDYIGSEYILKRIVGKFFCTAGTASANDANRPPQRLVIGAGFFIARAGGEGITGSPIGTDTADERQIGYGPLNLQTTREPWIWRRSWALSPLIFTDVAAVGDGLSYINMGTYPHNNYCGSVADGPHIDAKTARRITNDDRLFFAVQVWSQDADTGSGSPLPAGILDVRLLGALRKARGRSAF